MAVLNGKYRVKNAQNSYDIIHLETNANQVKFDDGATFQDKLNDGTLKGDKGDKGDKGADGLTTSVTVNGTKYTHSNGNITLPNYPTLSSLGAASSSHSHSEYVNQNAFSNIVVNSTTVAADSATDTLTLKAGSNITITADSTNDAITISATDTNTTYSAGTGMVLSGTTFNHKNSVTAGIAQGDSSKTLAFGETFTIPTVTYDAQGHITGKGTTTMTMPVNPNTDTHWTSSTVVGASATDTTNAASTNGSTYINHIENGVVRNAHKISGSGATTVTSDTDGNIVISSQNTNTDTKVTNTLNTTTKAYVTGTTSSSTNTGTQVFDTGVYLDTTAGQLTATTFKGSLSGNASSATKLATARTINGVSFDGTSNITITANPNAHNQASNTITAMTDYAKATDTSSITATDSLNTAIGKLERALDDKMAIHSHPYRSNTWTPAWSEVTSKPTFATVATSGSYNDLANKPTIHTINDSSTTSTTNTWSAKKINDSLAGKANSSHTHASTQITGLGTAATKNTGTASGNIPVLGSDGKLPTSILPSIAVNNTHTVETVANALSLACNVGDIVIITAYVQTTNLEEFDLSEETQRALNSGSNTFICVNKDATTFDAKFKVLMSSSDAVTHAEFTSSLNNKVDKVSGKQLSTNDYTTAEKNKLAGIAANANNYTHPSTHAATMIIEDSTHRFVTDAEKSTWNEKANSNHTHNYAGSSSVGGSANSAVKLATARTINGTSFDGSTNITTANWGTARNISIADSDGTNTGTAVSINGSGDAILKLPSTIKANLSGNSTSATTATKLTTARSISLGGILSGSANFDGSGNITITASANDITTITKSLIVGTSWMDTGITGTNLATGTYAVQMLVNDGNNTSQYQEYYSGTMSWFNGATNSTDADEILLHKAGHASNGRHVYLRTIRTANSGYLKLQISATHAFSDASNIIFKFKKLI